ncbi:MAG: ATP-grasp domain-containing protein [Phycisphaerales bacterium]|nr:ATP-grasp domain-containing protein [Phycisphaerales bacterium]
MSDRPKTNSNLAILFTCVGRRIELMQAFRAAAHRANLSLRLIAADQDVTAPGILCADSPILVPPATAPGYVPALLDVVKKHGARALIPTIDTDLAVISHHRDEFDKLGCTALIGPSDAIATCRDKLKTFELLKSSGIDTPETYTPEQVRAFQQHSFPYFLKPRFGSSSASVHMIRNQEDLDYYLPRGRDPIVQEFVAGVEHTLDVYVGLDGIARCVVPRRRWQVRAGEVSKGVVVKDQKIIDAGMRVCEALGRSMRGVVTLQCIVTPDNRIRFIEINPRFGGGAPLSIAAGADFPAWLLAELTGRPPDIRPNDYRHGLCMLRFDWAAFVQLDDDLEPRVAPPLRDWPRFE